MNFDTHHIHSSPQLPITTPQPTSQCCNEIPSIPSRSRQISWQPMMAPLPFWGRRSAERGKAKNLRNNVIYRHWRTGNNKPSWVFSESLFWFGALVVRFRYSWNLKPYFKPSHIIISGRLSLLIRRFWFLFRRKNLWILLLLSISNIFHRKICWFGLILYHFPDRMQVSLPLWGAT